VLAGARVERQLYQRTAIAVSLATNGALIEFAASSPYRIESFLGLKAG